MSAEDSCHFKPESRKWNYFMHIVRSFVSLKHRVVIGQEGFGHGWPVFMTAGAGLASPLLQVGSLEGKLPAWLAWGDMHGRFSWQNPLKIVVSESSY